jgi:hypothetical protein
LLVFEKKVLRTIFGPKIIVDGVYRYNLKLNRECNIPNVIGGVKSNSLRYAGHMIRSAKDISKRALLRAVPEGRRNQGTPKSRCVDGVNINS